MNQVTYHGIEHDLLKSDDPSAPDEWADAWADAQKTIDIDESVPTGQVRLAGNRYVSADEFKRMLRRGIR